ncbi:FAD-dependent oxidoreductase [Ramlibacter sp.]|uniref:NAD(P)/FAD-dependent oxidoreductase n=1 Tax=Ramlibacter sp. TaxID=1917967 RepID=UPI00182547A6|nr:FAD-dependent oxidoreductase [Ramlibacter sp.]MBA2672106.1 FAD-binding oxidoreductase [Ramlibacter sp.]
MPSRPCYDVLVVGGGVIGAAVLHALAKLGLHVGLAERGVIAQGCTAYSGGLVRVFHADERLSELAAASYPFYRDFEASVGEPCTFTQTGLLYFPAAGTEVAARGQMNRLAPRVPMAWLEAERVRAAHPEMHADGPAIHEPGAGYMSPPQVTRAFIRAARQLGAVVHEGTAIDKLVRVGDRYAGVETTLGTLFADRVVLALGPHTPSFLDQHRIPHALWAQRIQVDIRRPPAPPRDHPAWIDDVNQLNGRPHDDGRFLIGCPTHDIRFHDRPVAGIASHSDVIDAMGRRRFKWVADAGREGSYASFDCYSEGGLGTARFVDEARTLAVISGFSGGGFKLAPELARRTARLLAQEASTC